MKIIADFVVVVNELGYEFCSSWFSYYPERHNVVQSINRSWFKLAGETQTDIKTKLNVCLPHSYFQYSYLYFLFMYCHIIQAYTGI